MTVTGGVCLVHSRLEMCNVGGLASGGYSCVAENGLSTSNATFEVTIPGKDHVVNIYPCIACYIHFVHCYS